MNVKKLLKKRNQLRKQWTKIRNKKINYKNSLIKKNNSIFEIRKDSEYKKMKKEQNKFSTMIMHIEKKINKIRARANGKK